MSIKIYNVTGLGLVIGEKLSQDNENVYLKYPAILVLQAPTQQGPKDLLIEPIPPIFKGRNEMLKRFSIKKSMVLYGGQAEDKVIEMYEQYVFQLQTRLTGIQVVGAGAMPKEPINNKHRKPMRLV